MKIGFDISQTGAGKAGCGYFAHAMIKAMMAIAPQHRYHLYPSFGGFYFDSTMPASNPYPQADAAYGPHHSTLQAARAFWDHPELEARLGDVDLVHANNFWIPPQITSKRLIYTIYDLGFTANPNWTTEANRVGCFEGAFRSSVVADWVVAISEYTRADYLRTFPHFPADRIRVVHPCSRFDDPSRPGTRPAAAEGLAAQGFWLSVGTIEPRKNQRMLAQAYKEYRERSDNPMPLVLAGGNGWLMDDFEHYLVDLGLADHIVRTGYVSDDELIWLYRHCYANLYPSLFEGFGLPVLEGMQFGAATVCSNTTSMPEVAGDAAILLPPTITEAWVDVMCDLASDREKRDKLSIAARERAEAFKWERSAAALVEIYQDALRSPKRADLKQAGPAHDGLARIENVG